LYYNRERGELDTNIWAENDDEMVYSTVFGSLDYYALQHFVMWRERNGKDPYRKYDDFMEECLHIVYPNGNSIVTLNDQPRHPELDSGSLSNHSVSRADSIPTFAIGGQACLHQKSLHNITACPAPLLKAPLGSHKLIMRHCNE
jgi:hypothetical protein